MALREMRFLGNFQLFFECATHKTKWLCGKVQFMRSGRERSGKDKYGARERSGGKKLYIGVAKLMK
jgi:hypothetical protein